MIAVLVSLLALAGMACAFLVLVSSTAIPAPTKARKLRYGAIQPRL